MNESASELDPFVFFIKPWFPKAICECFAWLSAQVMPMTVGVHACSPQEQLRPAAPYNTPFPGSKCSASQLNGVGPPGGGRLQLNPAACLLITLENGPSLLWWGGSSSPLRNVKATPDDPKTFLAFHEKQGRGRMWGWRSAASSSSSAAGSQGSEGAGPLCGMNLGRRCEQA